MKKEFCKKLLDNRLLQVRKNGTFRLRRRLQYCILKNTGMVLDALICPHLDDIRSGYYL